MEGITKSMEGLLADDHAQVRNRRDELIAALSKYPQMQSFFKAATGHPVDCDAEPINLVREAASGSNTAMAKWMGITEAVMYNLSVELQTVNATLHRAQEQERSLQKALTIALAKGEKDSETTIPIKHPEAFTGDGNDLAKRTEDFKHWRQRVRTVWIDHPKQFRTERTKLTYFLTVLGGSALRGISKRLERVTEFPGDPTKWAWESADAVISELAEQYETFDEKTDALKKMTDLKQEGDYADYDRFAAYFTNLSTTLEWDDRTKVMQFELRLCGKLKKAIADKDDMPDDDDFTGWVARCRKITNRQATSAALSKMGQGLKTPVNPGNNNGNANSGKKENNKGDPMDLDAITLAISRLSQEEVTYRRANHLCLNCGKPGHVWRECRSKPASSRGGRGGFGRGNGRGGGGDRGGLNNVAFQTGGFNNFAQQQAGFGPQNNRFQNASFNNNGYNNQGGFNNNGFAFQNVGNGGFGGFGRGQNDSFGGFGRGNGRSGGYSANGNQQLRFADTPEYILPHGHGFVAGEVDSNYNDTDGGYSGGEAQTRSSHQGNE